MALERSFLFFLSFYIYIKYMAVDPWCFGLLKINGFMNFNYKTVASERLVIWADPPCWHFPVQTLVVKPYTRPFISTCFCKSGTTCTSRHNVCYFYFQLSLGKDDLWERDNGHVHLRTEPLRVPDGVHHARCVPGAVHHRPYPAWAWWVLVPCVSAVSLIPVNLAIGSSNIHDKQQ